MYYSDYRVWKECTRKVRYATQQRAEDQITFCVPSWKHDKLHTYDCPHCQGWHIGHKLSEEDD